MKVRPLGLCFVGATVLLAGCAVRREGLAASSVPSAAPTVPPVAPTVPRVARSVPPVGRSGTATNTRQRGAKTTVVLPTRIAPPSTRRPATSSDVSSTAPSLRSDGLPALRLVAAARSQIGVTTGYDPSYVGLAYPGGDVAPGTGVCSDVIVRALRGLSIDLQQRIHEDMRANFSEYPPTWNLSKPDPNIDQRRVGNIETYFARRGYSIAVKDVPAESPQDFLPGDIVSMKVPLDHIGIVSDRKVAGRPLLIHNIGNGTREEDVLFSWKIVGHYRVLR